MAKNHGNHGDREFVIFLPPYLWLELELCRGREGGGTTNVHGGDLRGADPGEGGKCSASKRARADSLTRRLIDRAGNGRCLCAAGGAAARQVGGKLVPKLGVTSCRVQTAPILSSLMDAPSGTTSRGQL